MKIITNHLLRIVMAVFPVISFVSANGANPTVTINYNTSGLSPGTAITVPIVIDGGGHNIGGFDLDINYNTDQLTYVNTNGQFIDLLLNGSFASVFSNKPDYKNRITWAALSDYVTLTNQVICNLHFIFKGGFTAMTFYFTGTLNDPGNSYITDDAFTYLPATWIPGSASGSFADIHSANGGGTWNTASKWDLGVVPNTAYNAFITLGNPITISTNARCNNMTINSGGQLTVNSSWSLAVNGNFSILDNGTDGSGSYVDFGTTSVAGTCSVERFMSGSWTSGTPANNMFHYISSPVTSGTIETFACDLLNKYNEPLQRWDSLVQPLTTALTTGTGYASALHDPGGIKTFAGGTLNTGDLNVSGLTYTSGGNASSQGYNLLGNIYPSGLLWDGTWSRTNVDASAWVWDDIVGHYWVNNGGTGTGTFGANGIIPSEQGFFVHVTAPGTGSVTIPNAKRQHSAQAYYKQGIPKLVNLKLEGNNGYDETVIYFNPVATAGYDHEFDAYKLFGGPAVTEIYTVIGDNTQASINVLPGYNHTTIVPVGIKTEAAGTYTITASGLESFPSGTSVFLEDLDTRQTVDLQANPVYSFNVSDPGTGHRFNLLFHPLGMPSVTLGNIKIYSYLKDVYVNIPASIHGNIIVYNLLGSEITRQAIRGNTLNKISLNSPTGYYIVKVIGDSGIKMGKVFIQ
jgi:hypothetical protein